MDKKLSVVYLNKLSFLSKSKVIVPAGTTVKD
jgi:flagellar biosynthesis regulator FlbT